MDIDRLIKYISLVTAIGWAVLAWIAVLKALGMATNPQVMGIPLVPEGLQVEQVGTYIIGLLYTVFRYVIYAVIVISGIQASLGLVSNFITAFVPISIPRGGVNTLLKNVIGLLIIKAVVDSALAYFGYHMAWDLLAYPSYLSYSTLLFGTVLSLILYRKSLGGVVIG